MKVGKNMRNFNLLKEASQKGMRLCTSLLMHGAAVIPSSKALLEK